MNLEVVMFRGKATVTFWVWLRNIVGVSCGGFSREQGEDTGWGGGWSWSRHPTSCFEVLAAELRAIMLCPSMSHVVLCSD